MTNLSIDTTLLAVSGGPFRRFLPVFDPHESERRELLMTPALHDWCHQRDDKKTLAFKANIRAFLGRFVKGERVCNKDYMKTWRDDVSEFRVQLQPRRENTRIFGAFLKPDCFVAFHPPRARSDFGGKHDPRWDIAIDGVTAKWANSFPGTGRVPSRPFFRCVTSNAWDRA